MAILGRKWVEMESVSAFPSDWQKTVVGLGVGLLIGIDVSTLDSMLQIMDMFSLRMFEYLDPTYVSLLASFRSRPTGFSLIYKSLASPWPTSDVDETYPSI